MERERGEVDKIADDLTREFTRDEADIEQTADEELARHPRSARVIRLLHAVQREQSQEQVGLAAAGAAFWLIISVFPTALAAVNLFGLVVKPGDVAKDLGDLANAGPSSMGATLTAQLQRIASADHTGLSVGLVVSLVLAVWSGSGGVYNLERAIRIAYGLPRERYVDARGRAFVGAFVVVIALGALAFVAAGVSGVLARVPAPVATIAGIPVVLVFVAAAIGALYRFSVAQPVGFTALLPGALASAGGLAVVVGGFATYLRFSGRFTAVYGALAGAVIVMIGTYLAVYVVLLGAVLNVQRAGALVPGAPSPPAAMPAR